MVDKIKLQRDVLKVDFIDSTEEWHDGCEWHKWKDELDSCVHSADVHKHILNFFQRWNLKTTRDAFTIRKADVDYSPAARTNSAKNIGAEEFMMQQSTAC